MKLHKNRKNRKGIQRFVSVALALCLTISTGSSYVSAENAGGTPQPHQHTEACYARDDMGGMEEQGEGSYGTTLICGYDEAEAADTAPGGEGPEAGADTSESGAGDDGAESPDADTSGTETPGAEASGTKEPAAETPGAKEPGTGESGAEGSGEKEPGAETPGAKEPGTAEPGAEASGTKEPDTAEPGAEVSATKEPAGEADEADSDIEWSDLSDLEELPAEAVGAAMWLSMRSEDEITDPEWWFDAYYVNQWDWYDVTMTENFNLKYQMEFHASKDFEKGEVVIEIEAELFKDRNGNSVTPTEIGIPQGTPDQTTPNRSTPFNYYYKNDGQTLVFFNYKKITSGTNAAWQVLYKDQKLMNIIDESAWTLTPKISVNGAGFTPIQKLTGMVDSWVDLESVTKSYYTESGLNYTPGLYTLAQVKRYIDGDVDKKFLNDEGRLDTANWHFVVWDVKVKGMATQPWNMIIQEAPGNGGVVVGYKDHSDQSTPYKLPIGTVVQDETTQGGTALTDQREESWGNRFYVVTAYPASQAKDGDKVSNDITIELVPADGKDSSYELPAGTATWTYEDYDWTYRGDIIGVQKETDKTVYTGWLDAYRVSTVNGKDYGDMPFTTTGHMYGYSYTHRIVSGSEESSSAYIVGDYIPNTYYTLTTVDDFMYLYADEGTPEIMGQGDYYFSGVTVTQTDYGYDVWEDERVDSELTKINSELLPGAFKSSEGAVKSAVRIYAMLANPKEGSQKDNWVLIDTVYLDASGRMEPYVFSDEVIAQEPWRVKVEHDTIDYETHCTIDVTVRIKSDSSKMAQILQERESAETNEASPEVKYENISGVLGLVHFSNGTTTYLTEKEEKKEEDGSISAHNYSEPGLIAATKALYKNDEGDGILLIRDNAYRTVTWLNETAAAFKNARSTNDVDNNRVLVDYYLTAYDGYEIYNRDSLNYLREEDQALISPGRSHVVFYDLLPYGMQFDASTPVTAGRITNLSKDTYQTQPKSWDSTQVTVTVDPEKDIIANYRGTGRTMVVFHIAFSGADATSYTNGKWVESWGVSFRAYYDWKDIDQLNEVEINANLCAFMPDFSEQSGGSNNSHPALVGLKSQVDYDNGTHGDSEENLAAIDRAYADMVKEYQGVAGNIDGYNLTDEKGNPYDTTYRNVLYAKNVLKDDVATSSESKIEKLVRADSDRFGAFGQSAVVPVGTGRDGFYTYDITVTTATGIKDIVIFDRLERAAADRKDTSNDPFAGEFTDGLITWSGTFRSLDTTGLDKQEITYKAYYSENVEAPISLKDEDPVEILTETNGWYTEEAFVKMLQENYGSDYTGNWEEYVKAVALQLLNDKDGNAFKLEPNNSVSFRVNMTAPSVEELEEGSSLSTYNNASFSSAAMNTGSQDNVNRSTVIGNSVKVSISNEERLEIIKETSGTVPAVHEGESFEFRLYEEYEYGGETVKQYLAYTEYQLYQLNGDNWEQQDGLHATDGNGYLYLHANEKAVFNVADAGRIQVKETENVFWESKVTEEKTEGDGGKSVRVLTVTNTYRPVLYMQKNLSAVPEGVDVSEESFTFKVEIKRNGNYVPLANAEFWYVDSVRLDGGIPGKLSSGTTGADGTFTIRKDDIVALFPGVAGTEYRVSEVINAGGDGENEVPWNWVCEIDNVTGTMTAAGVSKSITNYYKWKDLLLTKDITNQTQEDYDAAPQPFTFSISEVRTDEDGTEILIPMAGKEWELVGEAGNENVDVADGAGNESTGAAGEAGNEGGDAADGTGNENDGMADGTVSDEETYQTSGVLDQDGRFTCIMGFRTVRIKGLEAGKTYRIVELTEGIGTENGKPLYIPADDGEADTTMPVYSTRRDVTITNDYQKRSLTVKKTVAGSDDEEDSEDENEDAVKHFRFTVTVDGKALPEGTPYTVTKTGSAEEIRRIDADGYFILADGETAVFKNVGMVGDKVVVTEIDNGTQIYPADGAAYEGELSEGGAEASFVNGKPGSLLISKEYIGLDEKGIEAVEALRNGYGWGEGFNNGSVEFILTITDSEGTYVWPEMPVTVECIDNVNGYLGYKSYEPGDSITVEPWVTIIIPTGEGTSIPSDATYTLIEAEEYRKQMISYYPRAGEDMMWQTPYWLQISQSSASDTLADPETVTARPSATICNEVSGIAWGHEGSLRGKIMASDSEEVPEGKKLVWRVEQYDSGTGAWSPAEGVSYVVFTETWEGRKPVSGQVETTETDGRIILSKLGGSYVYPEVWFPNDIVYLNLYAESDIEELLMEQGSGKPLLRLVEVPEESDKEWGTLVGYEKEAQDVFSPGEGDDLGGLHSMIFSLGNEVASEDQGETPKPQEPVAGEPQYSMDVPPKEAGFFVNSNSKAVLEIEKYMAVSSDTLFTMILEQVVSTSLGDDGAITSGNYKDTIVAAKPIPGMPYTVYNADGSVAGNSVTGSGGEIQLEAGQYARLEVADNTMWLVSEKTAAAPNFKLKDLQPDSGDERMTKLNDNLMLINLKAKSVTHTLIFDANGGTGAPDTMTFVTDAVTPAIFTIPDQEPTREGYVFMGWRREDALANSKPAVSGDPVWSRGGVTRLIAVWGKECYIRYHYGISDEGSIYSDGPYMTGAWPQVLTIIADMSMTEDTSHYEFKGWSTSSGESKVDCTPGEWIEISDEDIDLYAVWEYTPPTEPEKPDCTVTFMDRGSLYGEVPIPKGSSIEMLDCTNDRSGYSFIGWTTNEDDFVGEFLIKPGDSIAINADITFYAVWKEASTVKYTY